SWRAARPGHRGCPPHLAVSDDRSGSRPALGRRRGCAGSRDAAPWAPLAPRTDAAGRPGGDGWGHDGLRVSRHGRPRGRCMSRRQPAGQRRRAEPGLAHRGRRAFARRRGPASRDRFGAPAEAERRGAGARRRPRCRAGGRRDRAPVRCSGGRAGRSMKIAFLIERRNYYRLFGPIIDRALERGWRTECWHDGGYRQRWLAGSESPEAPATFRHGTPRVRTYRGAAGLPGLLAEERPDVVISLRQAAAGEKRGRLAWFGLQYTLDVADLLDGGGETTCDGIGLHTQYWRDRTTDCLRIKAYNRSRTQRAKAEPVDDAAVAETLRRYATLVGIPEMDQCHGIDPAAVRGRLGIEPDRPVVLYIPFPFASNPRTFWVRHVYGSPNTLWTRAAIAVARRNEYRSHVAALWQEWFLNPDSGGSFNFPGVVYARALGEFLDGFASARLSDYPLDPVARAQYLEKFVGVDDGKSSDRVLDAVQSLVERGALR